MNFSFKERKETLICYGKFGKINFLVPEYVFILHDVLERCKSMKLGSVAIRIHPPGLHPIKTGSNV